MTEFKHTPTAFVDDRASITKELIDAVHKGDEIASDKYWLRYFCAQAMAGLSMAPDKKTDAALAHILATSCKMLEAIKKHEAETK
jgi:hypothetical protein